MNHPDMPASRRPHLEQVLAHENAFQAEVKRLVEEGEESARDVLVDMSFNSDRQAAMAEFSRDTDYAITVASLWKSEATS